MATVTGLDIRAELAKWGLIRLLGTTTAAGTAAYLTDVTRLDSDAIPSTAYNGSYVRFPQNRTDSDTDVNETFAAGDVTLTVDDGTKFAVNDIIAIDDEWLLTTSISSNDLTVTRGYLGTSDVGHDDNSDVYHVYQSGFQAKVDYLDQANGRLYLTPSHVRVTAINQPYEVWRSGLDPDDVDRARDEALTRICSQWALQPLTEIPNGDLEDVLSASNWTISGSGTVSIQTLSFPSEHFRNSILQTNAGANEYVLSASMYVRPGRTFYVYIPVSVRSGTAELIVRDVTNGANIALSGTGTTTTLRGWTAFEATAQTPSGCGEIQIWLRGQESSAVIEWGPAHFNWDIQYRIQLPSRVISRKHVGTVQRFINYALAGDTSFRGDEWPEEVRGVDARQVRDAVVLEFENPMTQRPHFFEERIFYDALSTDYKYASERYVGDRASTECPLDYVAAATVALLAEQYSLKQPEDIAFWQSALTEAEAMLDRFEREFGPEVKPQQERERTIYVPQLRI